MRVLLTNQKYICILVYSQAHFTFLEFFSTPQGLQDFKISMFVSLNLIKKGNKESNYLSLLPDLITDML